MKRRTERDTDSTHDRADGCKCDTHGQDEHATANRVRKVLDTKFPSRTHTVPGDTCHMLVFLAKICTISVSWDTCH